MVAAGHLPTTCEQDFYMEMHWSFECSNVLAPIVKAVAPHDHYRIWKKGSWLRMDSTITGKRERKKERDH